MTHKGEIMKIALIQMAVCPDKTTNLTHASDLIRAATASGADLVMLPEMFCCEYNNNAFLENREPAGGAIWQSLSHAAATNKVWLIGGSFPEAQGNERSTRRLRSTGMADRQRFTARCTFSISM